MRKIRNVVVVLIYSKSWDPVIFFRAWARRPVNGVMVSTSLVCTQFGSPWNAAYALKRARPRRRLYIVTAFVRTESERGVVPWSITCRVRQCLKNALFQPSTHDHGGPR
jgi:hypothetical protein